MHYYVYQLRASDESQPFYIGKSFKGSKRLVEHHYEARNYRRMKSSKIISILKRDAYVIEEILFWFDDEESAHAKERELIKLYGRRDVKTGFLTNQTDGGEGFVGQVCTPETRAKMSKAKQGNKINLGRRRPDFAEKWKKPITMFGKDGRMIKHFESSKDCVEETGIHKATLSDCLCGKFNTVRSPTGIIYQFRFGELTDDLPPIGRKQQKGKGEVGQYTKDKVLIRVYKNASEAGQLTGIASGSIRLCVTGKAASAGGFVWNLINK